MEKLQKRFLFVLLFAFCVILVAIFFQDDNFFSNNLFDSDFIENSNFRVTSMDEIEESENTAAAAVDEPFVNVDLLEVISIVNDKNNNSNNTNNNNNNTDLKEQQQQQEKKCKYKFSLRKQQQKNTTTTTSSSSSNRKSQEEEEETKKMLSCPVLYYIPEFSPPGTSNNENNENNNKKDKDFLEIPSNFYNDGMCFSLNKKPDGRFYEMSFVMNGYHLDYGLIEAMTKSNQPYSSCRLTSLSQLIELVQSSSLSSNSTTSSTKKMMMMKMKKNNNKNIFEVFETEMKNNNNSVKIIGVLPTLFQTGIAFFHQLGRNMSRGGRIFPNNEDMFRWFIYYDDYRVRKTNPKKRAFSPTSSPNNTKQTINEEENFLSSIEAKQQIFHFLREKNRWFTFVPSFLRPHPQGRILGMFPQINTITNEPGLNFLKPRMKVVGSKRRGRGFVRNVFNRKTENIQIHYKLKHNLTWWCRRHIVIPKVDWHFSEKVKKIRSRNSNSNFNFNNNNNKNNKFLKKEKENKKNLRELRKYYKKNYNKKYFIYFVGRTSTQERERLRLLSIMYPEDIFYRDAESSETIVNEIPYREEMKRSLFCIDTTGDDLTTRRITTAVLSGCIPLLICDDCVFPFPKLFSYQISDSYEDVVRDVGSSNYDSSSSSSTFSVLSQQKFPSFFVRLRQFPTDNHTDNVLLNEIKHVSSSASSSSSTTTTGSKKGNILKLMRQIREDKDLIFRLQENVKKVQAMFLSMLDRRSTLIDTMLLEMRRSLEEPWKQDSFRLLCPV